MTILNVMFVAMIKRGEIQRNDSIDFLDNLDFDFFKNDNGNSQNIAEEEFPSFGVDSGRAGGSGGAIQHQPFSQSGQNPTLLQHHHADEFSFDQQFDDDHVVSSSRYPNNNNAVPSFSNFGVANKSHGDGSGSGSGTAYSSNRPRNASIDSLVSFMTRRDSYDMGAMLNPDGQSDAYIAGSLGDTNFDSIGGLGHGRKSSSREHQKHKHKHNRSAGGPGASASGGHSSGKFANVFDEDSEASYFQQFQNMQHGNYPFDQSGSGSGKAPKSEKSLSKAQLKQQAASVLKSSLLKSGEMRTEESPSQIVSGRHGAGQGSRERTHSSSNSNSSIVNYSASDGPHSSGNSNSSNSGNDLNAPNNSQGYVLNQAQQQQIGQGQSSSPPQGSAFIGVYSAEARKQRIERFMEKRNRRVWTKRVKYDVRKNFADSRIRVKGRFVKKEDEDLLRVCKDINEEN